MDHRISTAGEPEHSPVPGGFPIVPGPGAVDDQRRDALSVAVDEARGAAGRTMTALAGGAGGISVRVFAPGRLVLALAGRFDRVGLEQLDALLPALERHAYRELVIDLSGLRECERALAGLVGHLRIRRLTAEAHVELHGVPEALRHELGQASSPG